MDFSAWPGEEELPWEVLEGALGELGECRDSEGRVVERTTVNLFRTAMEVGGKNLESVLCEFVVLERWEEVLITAFGSAHRSTQAKDLNFPTTDLKNIDAKRNPNYLRTRFQEIQRKRSSVPRYRFVTFNLHLRFLTFFLVGELATVCLAKKTGFGNHPLTCNELVATFKRMSNATGYVSPFPPMLIISPSSFPCPHPIAPTQSITAKTS